MQGRPWGDDDMKRVIRKTPTAAGCTLVAILLLATDPQAQQPAREGARTSLHNVQVPPGPAGEAKIDVAAVILAAPATEVALPIIVGPPSAIPPQSFVRIRGLPPTAALSDGHAIQPGAWAVPLAALANLRMILPAGLSGKREVTISLVTSDGATIAEAKAALVVAAAGLITPEVKPPTPKAATALPPLIAAPVPGLPLVQVVPASPPAPTSTTAPAQPPAPKTPAVAALPPTPELPAALAKPKAPPPLAPEARRRAAQYLDRATVLLKDGDIASARLFLQRAADEGLAEAALVMGGTFDGAELALLKAHGIRPDPAEARRWYERAAELGSGEAQDRLQRLGAR